MLLKKTSSTIVLTAAALAILFGLFAWSGVHAKANGQPVLSAQSLTVDVEQPLQQTMPVSETMPMQHAMPMTATMPAGRMTPGAPPVQQNGERNRMGQMMAKMAEMQGMMGRMQSMMASMPMSGTMPVSGMMQGDMNSMKRMMGEMQGMMAQMQGMMAEEMMSGESMSGGAPMTRQMQGQQMQGGMMAQPMPMMGTVIYVFPFVAGMAQQQMPGMGMMGQMPMMQSGMGSMMQGGMEMGGMMQGDGQRQDAPTAGQTEEGAASQTGQLGAIAVKVTPPDLSDLSGDMIEFAVDLNATGADLSIDLSELATLRLGDHEMVASMWEVELDHGHHVKGVLHFVGHTAGDVDSVTLLLADPAGGTPLSLTWPVSE